MFSTTDVYLTAALAALGYRHTSTRKGDKRIIFLWEDPQAKELANRYYTRKLQIDAKTMSDEIKGVKTQLHNMPPDEIPHPDEVYEPPTMKDQAV